MSLKLNGNSGPASNPTGLAFQTLRSPTNDAEIKALKLARTVVKNLYSKGVGDEKFRTLKTTNPKVAAQLLSQPPVVGFLLSVGVTNTGEALTYSGEIDVARLQQEFEGVDTLLRTALQSLAPKSSAPTKENSKPRAFIDPTKGSGGSIKAQMRAKEELKKKALKESERKRKKELLKGFDKDKQARKAPGWEAKLSGANKGAAPTMQASSEGNANLQAH